MTACAEPLKNYIYFEDTVGIYTFSYEQTRKENCLVCNRGVTKLEVKSDDKLQDLLDLLVEKFQVSFARSVVSISV